MRAIAGATIPGAMANTKKAAAARSAKKQRAAWDGAFEEMFPVTALVPARVITGLDAERQRLRGVLGSRVSMATAVRSALVQWVDLKK